MGWFRWKTIKCVQCKKERLDVAALTRKWANSMVFAHMIMGTYQSAKKDSSLFPRHAGDFVCRECRLVSAVVLSFFLIMVGFMVALVMYIKS